MSLIFHLPLLSLSFSLQTKLLKAKSCANLLDLCDGRVEVAYAIERVKSAVLQGGLAPMQPFRGAAGAQQQQQAAAAQMMPLHIREERKKRFQELSGRKIRRLEQTGNFRRGVCKSLN